eukprot:gene28542-4025_t
MSEEYLGVTPEQLSDLRVWSGFLNNYSAKDKIARLLSYGGKAVGYYTGDNADLVGVTTLANRIASQLSLHRKSLKLGKWIIDYYKTLDAVRAGMATMSTTTDAIRLVSVAIAYGLYVPHEFVNNLLWAQSLGVITKRKWLSSLCTKVATRTRSGAKRLKLVWTMVKICSDLGLN